jgi:hypothetical protein
MFFLPDWGKNLLDGGSKQKPPHRKDAGALFYGIRKDLLPAALTPERLNKGFVVNFRVQHTDRPEDVVYRHHQILVKLAQGA